MIGAREMSKLIRLVVADIDGCFTFGGRSRLDVAMCQRMQDYNEQSKENPLIPALVFCTGRPLPYIQAMKQAAGCYLPSIAEFGAVVWCPVRQSHFIHPQYTPDERRRYEELMAEAEKEFGAEDSEILIEAGKVCQLTLYPRHPATVEDMIERVEKFHERWRDYYVLDRTPAVLNFMPSSVNKGTALEWLAEFAGIELSQMAGIGDSESDWNFLQHCAISATPSNGRPYLKERCTWVLESGPVACMLELYEKLIELNRSRAKAAGASR